MNKNELLNTIQVEEQVTPKTRNRKLPCFSIFGDTSHMPTIQNMKTKIDNAYLIITNGLK